jgi:hypothetical protein
MSIKTLLSITMLIALLAALTTMLLAPNFMFANNTTLPSRNVPVTTYSGSANLRIGSRQIALSNVWLTITRNSLTGEVADITIANIFTSLLDPYNNQTLIDNAYIASLILPDSPNIPPNEVIFIFSLNDFGTLIFIPDDQSGFRRQNLNIDDLHARLITIAKQTYGAYAIQIK